MWIVSHNFIVYNCYFVKFYYIIQYKIVLKIINFPLLYNKYRNNSQIFILSLFLISISIFMKYSYTITNFFIL